MRSAIAGAAGVIAMLTSLGVAAGLTARRVPTLVAKMSLVTIACAIACAAYFVMKMPELQGTAIGAGMILFAAAIVIGSVTPLAVLRRRRAWARCAPSRAGSRTRARSSSISASTTSATSTG